MVSTHRPGLVPYEVALESDEAVLELAEAREMALEVEHFELDGWAVLSLVIEAAE